MVLETWLNLVSVTAFFSADLPVFQFLSSIISVLNIAGVSAYSEIGWDHKPPIILSGVTRPTIPVDPGSSNCNVSLIVRDSRPYIFEKSIL